MTYWKTPTFKSLQQAWYARLEANGFLDAEELSDDGELRLRMPRGNKIEDREIRENYYRLISQKVQETVFTNEIDLLILTRHSEGTDAKDICEELKKLGTPRHRHTVRFTVRRYETRWGIRSYTPEKLGKKHQPTGW